MTAAEIQSSPIITTNTGHVKESSHSSQSEIKASCDSYHRDLDVQHSKIYRYNAFDELVLHLQTTILTSLPYINYPSNQVMSMILTGTQLSQAEDSLLNKTINLSNLCTKYLHTLLSIFDFEGLEREDEAYMIILNEEMDNLYRRLSLMFRFLEPTEIKRNRRKKQIIKASDVVLSLNSSTIEDSDEETFYETTTDLSKNKFESLFQVSTASEKILDSSLLFGLPHLANVEKNMWCYFVYTFKLASKLCDIERLDTFLLYKETSSRWLEFIKILLRYLKLDLTRKSDLSESLLSQNLLRVSRCSNFKEASTYQLSDSLLTLTTYAFTDLNTPLERSQMLSIDLTLTNPSHICPALAVFEKSNSIKRLDLESIPMRYELLQLVWQICQHLHIPSVVKFKFINSVASHMNSLSAAELAVYFQCSSQNMLSSILFPVSFEIMRLMFKAWTVTSENYSTDIYNYIQQIQKLLQFIQATDADSFMDEDMYILSDINPCAKKVAALLKFQLSAIITKNMFNQRELELLQELVISIENKVVSIDSLLTQNNV